jgi:4-amino-4-deoxy-L-arabinose transferase-like glycosyltransferase
MPKLSEIFSKERLIDGGLLWAIGFGYLLLLLLTARDIGYARDEGFYFSAASSYGKWFNLLFTHPSTAFQRANVDRYWADNHEHPALIKSLFWASNKYLRGLPLIASQGTSYRFPAMALSALCLSCIYAWGRRLGGERDGRILGVIAALSFGFMPQVFHHAHLACFDMPVAAMWFFTTYAYWLCCRNPSFGKALLTAVLYGLLLNTKHNSWILPAALFLHFFLDRLLGLRAVKLTRLGLPLSWLIVPIVGPAVFFSTWPWIWFDTVKRLREYVTFHTQHVYYNMEFLGKTYFEPPMPRLYAWVMTLATVPTITLTLFVIGLFVCVQQGLWPSMLWRLRALKGDLQSFINREHESASASDAEGTSVLTEEQRAVASSCVLWLVCIAASYGPWLMKKTPIFGGTKHWLTAYPFLALIAAFGFVYVIRLVDPLVLSTKWRTASNAVWGGLVVLVPLVIALHAEPWGLAAYVPVVGGAPGAASLGLNRSFWGYATASVAPVLNDEAQKGARVFIHDTAEQSWQMMEKDKILRKDLQPWPQVSGSDWALYHHEQHMGRVEYMTWVDYGTAAPEAIGAYDGVPVVWLYRRPSADAEGNADADGE